jgi:hypothetical protein
MEKKQLTERQVRSLTHLGFHVDRIRTLDQQTFVHVRSCRKEGCSWSMIGTVIGVTGQAAWQRYHTDHVEVLEPRIVGEVQLPFEHTKGNGNHSTAAEYKACSKCGGDDLALPDEDGVPRFADGTEAPF